MAESVDNNNAENGDNISTIDDLVPNDNSPGSRLMVICL
jgi:hypothetical protein